MEDNKICPIMSRPLSKSTSLDRLHEIICLKERCMAWHKETERINACCMLIEK